MKKIVLLTLIVIFISGCMFGRRGKHHGRRASIIQYNHADLINKC